MSDGGQAFPAQAVFSPECGTMAGWPGMSLRDYFAAMALQGFLACPHQFVSDKGPVERNPVLLASIAYCQADAMLKERVK